MPDSSAAENSKEKNTPHYHGHRDRLRGKFLDNGAEALADYELVELLLFSAIPRRDVKPLAKKLLETFGGISGVLNASHAELGKIGGLSEKTIIMLKTVQALQHRAAKQDIMQKPILNSWNRLMEYCQLTMAHEQKEHFRILFLNKKNELIADEIQQSGTVDHTPAYPREIMKRALQLGATAGTVGANTGSLGQVCQPAVPPVDQGIPRVFTFQQRAQDQSFGKPCWQIL